MRGGTSNRTSGPGAVSALAVAIGLVLVTSLVVLVLPSPSSARRAEADPDPVPRRSVFQGLGAWVDMYAWSYQFSRGAPSFGAADVDAMAAAGVQTLFIQAASQTGPASVLEPARLLSLIQRARREGISVVVWYLPALVNPADDLARIMAIARLPNDGLALDIESADVANVNARNAALVALAHQVRGALPGHLLGAIVFPATLLEAVNPLLWPSFPYTALAPLVDAWLPMTYWTDRLPQSGFRDGYRYTVDSVARLRADLGPVLGPQAVVDPIGGVSVDGLGAADLAGFLRAVNDSGSAGGSLYEWPGTSAGAWAILQPLRR